MTDIAIRVENLSKHYRIGGMQEPYRTLRDALTDVFVSPFRRAGRLLRGQAIGASELNESIWALEDVSFEIKQGEVIGIIGRNGAGKSTLLKILSRITEPTEGYADVYGRVGSLLEVGTGFHSELSGRENIYLNGAILGMRKAEIDKKFDEIVVFAEVEKFIDTPVKHYSTGMYLRLAFAVAAHLEPQILLIDEVLAVGDAQFQKKCLGKMGEVAEEGRTVLFVSHNMAAIQNLCKRALLLDGGHLIIDSTASSVVDKYLNEVVSLASIPLSKRNDRQGNQCMKFTSYCLLNENDELISQAIVGKTLKIVFHYETKTNKSLKNVHVGLGVNGKYNEKLFYLSTELSHQDFDEIPPEGKIICCIQKLPLQPGMYSFNLISAAGKEIADHIQEAGVIEVAAGDYFGSGKMISAKFGPFLVDHTWQVSYE